MLRVLLTSLGLLVTLTGCQASLHALNRGPSGSNGHPGTGDTGTHDTGTHDTGSQDTGSSQGHPPSLDSFSVSSTGTDVVVLFSASDADGDLSGGKIDLTVNGTGSSYRIPGDLDSWNGTSGTVKIPVPGSGSCDATVYSVSGTLQDASGLRSTSRSGQTTVSGSGGVPIDEIGDDGSAQDLGTLNPPVTLCGDIWGASNDGTAYTSDFDVVMFTVGAQGTWNFSLTWSSTGDDYDMHLWDVNDTSAPVVYSETDGPTQPEAFAWPVLTGEQYYLDVGAWSGSGGSYAITITAQ